MKVIGIIGTATLGLLVGIAAPAYAQQEQHEQQQQEHKDKPAQHEEKHAQQEEKKAQQDKPAERHEQHAQKRQSEKKEEHHEQAQRGGGNGRGRMSEDHFRTHFGREHVFVINHPVIVEGHPRFQYGGYWFGYGEPWPVGWYYTDNVYVDYIDGGYYLYNPVHPGIRISINLF